MTNSKGEIDNTDIKSLVQKRSAIKAKITRFATYVDTVNPNNSIEIVTLKLKLAKFNQTYQEYDNVQSEIENLDINQSADRDHFESHYFDTATKAELILNPITDPSSSVYTSTQTQISQSANDSASKVNLPPITLPSFDGSQNQWLSFYETFKAMVDNEDKLTNLQKLYYLKSCLTGEAANIISTLVIDENNYKIALDLLVDRYNNKKLIIKNHLNALFDIENISKPTSHTIRNLIDKTNLNIKILKQQSLPTDHWDVIIIHLMLSKLDFATRKDWEHINNDDIPTLSDFIKFLTKRCQSIESLERDRLHVSANRYSTKPNTIKSVQQRATYLATDSNAQVITKCKNCQAAHSISHCEEFLNMSVKDLIKRVEKLKLCKNCLKGHTTGRCQIKHTCKICHKRHNTLLHLTFSPQQTENTQPENNIVNNPSTSNVDSYCNDATTESNVMLSTAIVYAFDAKGECHELRALLDQGAQSNFITEDGCKKLQSQLIPVNVLITGIGQVTNAVPFSANVEIQSRCSNYNKTINCLARDKLTNKLPSATIPLSKFKLPDNISLADPKFNISTEIDLVLGAEVFWNVLEKKPTPHPYLHCTRLGWVIGGAIKLNRWNKSSHAAFHSCAHVDGLLHKQMEKFWEIDTGFITERQVSHEERTCERQFVESYKRNADGRFVVKLPFKYNFGELGNSSNIALKRFYNMEHKLNKNEAVKRQYQEFMTEYFNLGHMELVPQRELNRTSNVIYLPHHPVFKESSLTSKIRVVFDTSVKSTTGVSLNDTLMVGPTIQDDLLAILLRFRTFKYALAADITKMYRQILLDPADANFQRIFWRNNTNEEVKVFRLKTVTYGTSSAPFLAIRALRQLAIEKQSKFKSASKTILRDFYVDNLLTGTNNLNEGLLLRTELIQLLKNGGFELRPWASNNQNLLSNLVESSTDSNIISLDKQGETKTLGVTWNCTAITH